MARYPGALWLPLPENATQPRIVPTQVIIHSAVSASDSLRGYFTSTGIVVESHFYIRNSGAVEQYLDTTVQADANFHANPRAVSIETEDNGNPDKYPWTDAQLAALVALTAWLCRTHKIPGVRCPAWNEPGLGYHTMWGAPSQWTPVAKSCPGAARVPQFPGVVSAVAAQLRGGVVGSVVRDYEEEPLKLDAEDQAFITKTIAAQFQTQPSVRPGIPINEALSRLIERPAVAAADVDEDALAAALAPLLAGNAASVISSLSDADIAKVARAAADEEDLRMRQRLGMAGA